MMNPVSALTGLLLLLSATHAQAREMDVWRNAASPLRIQTSMTIQLPPQAPGAMAEQTRALEQARRLIYEAVARECALLAEIFKAECRLVAINANSQMQDRGNGQIGVYASGNGNYELTPKAP